MSYIIFMIFSWMVYPFVLAMSTSHLRNQNKLQNSKCGVCTCTYECVCATVICIFVSVLADIMIVCQSSSPLTQQCLDPSDRFHCYLTFDSLSVLLFLLPPFLSLPLLFTGFLTVFSPSSLSHSATVVCFPVFPLPTTCPSPSRKSLLYNLSPTHSPLLPCSVQEPDRC